MRGQVEGALLGGLESGEVSVSGGEGDGEGSTFAGGVLAWETGGFGGTAGLGFSGLIPPSQCGPVYKSEERLLSFHFCSKKFLSL